MSTLRLNADDSGTTHEMKTGDLVSITLPENPTTGFRWSIVATDETILQPEEDDFAPASTAIGSGGDRTILLRAAAPGSVEISLEEARAWEPESPLNRFSVHLMIG
ncbi:MAG: protease inhibitor I42 family protein [Thermomicrobiales bacterium]|nr:protease inhibitor I42 family protein [Thermomicrobiales bacterium]